MGFGGAASAMNAAIKRNAALRKGCNNLFDRQEKFRWEYEEKDTTTQRTCSPAIRKANRDKLRREQDRDRKRAALGYTVGVVVTLVLVFWLW